MQKGFAPIVWVVIAVILLGGGYYTAQKSDSILDAWKTWQTYRNGYFGFEIKYPPDRKVRELSDSVYFALSFGDLFSDTELGGMSFSIWPSSHCSDQNPPLPRVPFSITDQEFRKKLLRSDIFDIGKPDGLDDLVVKYDNLATIDGTVFQKQRVLNKFSQSKIYDRITYTRNLDSRCDRFILQSFKRNLSEFLIQDAEEEVFAEIVRSFRILSSAESASIRELWKSYRNDEYGFEFNYPNSFGDFEDVSSNQTHFKVKPLVGLLSHSYVNPAYLQITVLKSESTSLQCEKDSVSVKINGLEWCTISGGMEGSSGIVFSTLNNDKSLEISIYLEYDESKSEFGHSSLIDPEEIIKTFKFTK